MYVILRGNPVDGFGLVGPFHSRSEAVNYGNDDDMKGGVADWWVAEVHEAHPEARINPPTEEHGGKEA